MEPVLVTVAILAVIYLALEIYTRLSWKISNIRTKVKNRRLKNVYNRYMDILYQMGLIDNLEHRKKEFEDAPNKLCNQQCTTRQKYLIKMYEKCTNIINKVETVELLELEKMFDKFEELYNKSYAKIKDKYDLKGEVKKWKSGLDHFG